jgi:outer membrane usher protein
MGRWLFTRRCALSSNAALLKPHLQGTKLSGLVFLVSLVFMEILLFLLASISTAGETVVASASAVPARLSQTTTEIVINISVNGKSQGDFFTEQTADGELFIKVEDALALKMKITEDRIILIGNDRYIPLNGIRDIKYVFDDKSLTLSIIETAGQKTSVDLYPLQPKPQDVYYPRENSAFLNYGLTYSYTSTDGFQSFIATNKLGLRSGDIFFTSDSLYTKTESSSSFVRLQSSATYERWGDLQWVVLGDQFANSGDLGSTVNMGGLGLSKVYRMDPYFITQPVFSMKGTATYPSQAQIYLDGVLVGTQPVNPGAFELKNIYSITGAHNIDVVLKDPFGNEQRISYPVYFSTQLLREGLHEYSYNVGFLREQYGTESNDYGKAVFSAFHRYGVTNSLNIGARYESSDSIYNGGVAAALSIPRLGNVSVSFAGSDANGEKGSAGSFQHSYQYGSFNTSLLFRGFSRNYATVGAPPSPDMTKYEMSLAAGFLMNFLGGISLSYSQDKTYSGLKTSISAANYSLGISRSTSLFATAQATRQSDTTYSFFVGLNFSLASNVRGAAQYTKTGSTDTETVQMQKDIPLGEGVGYRATLNRQGSAVGNSYALNPYVQYNSPYGIYAVDAGFRIDEGNSAEAYSVSASGSIVYAGGFWGISRPVSDSFAFVMTDGLKGANVQVNNQDIGRTDGSGKMIVPTLASYNYNQVTLDTRNIPMDVSISSVSKKLSPPLWSGSCVSFDAKKVRALVGALYVQEGNKNVPLEYVDIILKIGDKEVTSPTGKNGEFYLENSLPETASAGTVDNLSCRAIAERRKTGGNMIRPGTYSARVDYEGRTCAFSVTFPETEEAITDIGEVICKPQTVLIQPQNAAQDDPARTAIASVPAIVPPAHEHARIQPPPAPANVDIPSKKDLPLTFVVRPRISFDVPFKSSGRRYSKSNAGDLTILLVKCGRETRLVFSNVGDDIVTSVCPAQGSVTEVITRDDLKALAAVVHYLARNPGTIAEIEGHSDRHGSTKDALRHGNQLASIIKEYLIRSGVKTDQIAKIESLGRGKMLCQEKTAACDVMNRRVVIRIVPKKAETGTLTTKRGQITQ